MLIRSNRALQIGVAAIVAASLLVACGKSNNSNVTPSTPSTVSLQGAVSAPGGTVAFVSPTGLQRFFAAIVGSDAIASLPGDQPVAGATVKLIEINAAGTQVGADIATATTDSSGNYTLVAPAGFTPGPQYVVRVQGTTTNLDTLVTGTTAQDVNAATDAGKTLILGTVVAAGGSLAALDVGQVTSVTDAISALTLDIDPSVTPIGTPAQLSAALAGEAQNQEEVNNQVQSVAGTSTLSGTVTSNGTALANIRIVVRDYRNWLTRATALTDGNGNYTLNLPAGDYIVGALNFTGTSMAASAWWTSDCATLCTVNNQFSAAKTTVGAGTTTRNFILDNGGRISGTVTAASGGAALAGITVAVRDFASDEPVAFTRTKPDGSFRVNVKPGTYTLGIKNGTIQAYAGGLYNGPATGGTVTGGGMTAAQATPLSVSAGSARTANFALVAGHRIAGIVTDGPGGAAVSGINVRFYGDDNTDASTYGAFVEARPTNVDGRYRLWLQPGPYVVRSRGQAASVDVSAADVTQDFASLVGRVTLTVQDASNNPVSQAKVGVYDNAGNYLGFEISSGDGTTELYSTTTATDHRIDIKMDGGQAQASSIYLNQTQLLLGSAVAFTVGSSTPIDGGGTAYPVVTLPAGGVLSGTVTKTGVAAANYLVQVRSGGTAATNRFVSTRTQSDGSYTISLPAGSYAVRACDPTNCAGVGAMATGVAVSAGSPTTQNIAVP